ncbi:MAG: hypothetical protein R6U28_12810 [Cyclonatronaceae bacterium]
MNIFFVLSRPIPKSVTPTLVLFFLVLTGSLLPAAPASSQMRNTLFGWEEWTRLMILDQSHSHGGLFYDRGLFRYTTPDMTKEHDLDLVTYEFTSLDQYGWYYSGEDGFRAYTGSMDLGKFLTSFELRNRRELTGRLSMNIRVLRRYDMRADRALLWLDFDYRLRDGQTVGIRQTLTEKKSDLDFTLYYRYGSLDRGFIELEATLPDFGNNAIYALSESRDRDFEESRKYHRWPLLFSFRASTPEWHGLRGEALGGILTRSQAQVGLQSRADDNTRDRQNARYAGALLEWSGSGITAALTWQYHYAQFDRENFTDNFDEPIDYGNMQYQSRLGGFLGLEKGRIRLQNWIWRARVRDRQRDEHHERFYSGSYQIYPFDFKENRTMMKNRILYMPETRGMLGGLEWSADYRDFLDDTFVSDRWGSIRGFSYRRQYPFQLDDANERITLLFGYRFSPNIHLIMGASYDIDGDMYGGSFDNRIHPRSYFDGGFGRLTMTW